MAFAGAVIGAVGSTFLIVIGWGMISAFIGLGTAVEEAQNRLADESRHEMDLKDEISTESPISVDDAVHDNPEEAVTAPTDRLAGDWYCVSELCQDGPVSPRYHRQWTFQEDRLTINGDRKLWYGLEEQITPKRLYVYNSVAGRTVNVYACIFRFKGDDLIICSHPSDSPPAEFECERGDTFLLTFRRENLEDEQKNDNHAVGEQAKLNPFREWADNTGQFKVTARLSGRMDDSVRRIKEDGSAVAVPIEKLSKQDREFLENRE